MSANPTSMPPTESRPALSQAEQDYVAALYEIKSNLEVRRLMIVLANILVPACCVAVSDCLTGADYPPPLRWLPEHILLLVGALLALSGILVTAILTRCHFGLVVNSAKLRRVVSGELGIAPLNWLGVTTNFVALTALYSGTGLSLLLATFGWTWWALAAGLALIVLSLAYLAWTHGRANRLCRRLEGSWQHGAIAPVYQEQHARESLDTTTADVSVIVVMAVALFSGTFNAMTNIGGIEPALAIHPTVAAIKEWGVIAVSGLTLVSLLLSGRMIVRLRIALAEHSEALARLRNEPDDPWHFTPRERTFLLFLLLHGLTAAAALILLWAIAGAWTGLVAALALLIVGAVWYPLRLDWEAARRMAVRRVGRA
ncbi:MAG: hypothetical protein U1F68_16085 [Gammaproteobacteria bacterium]